MAEATILIVEDDAILALHMQEMLTRLGYAVPEPLATGEEALVAVSALQPDLIIMDIELAGTMNGIEAAEKIALVNDVPIVFFTGFSHDPLLKHAKNAAPYGYLIKPVPERELAATVEMALHRHALDRKLKQLQAAQEKSEAQYRQIFENAPVGIFRSNLQGRFLAINACMVKLLGYDSQQEVVATYTDLGRQLYVEPGRREAFIAELIRNGQVDGFEFEARKKNGERIWLGLNARLITAVGDDAQSDRQVIDGFAVDITERRLVAQKLRRSEEMHRALVAGIPDIVKRLDRQGRHLFVSENIQAYTGLPAGHFVGKNHHELGFSPEMSRLWGDSIKSVFQSALPVEKEFTYAGRGEPKIFNLRLIPELNRQGQVETVLSLCRDITAQRRSEQDYHTLFHEMLNGFALHEIICDSQGQPVDYRFLAVNPAFERKTGLKAADIVGRTMGEIFPDFERFWIDTYGRVALTGEPCRFERYFPVLQKYFEITAFRPARGQFACIVHDISERRRAENKIRRDEARLRKLVEILQHPVDDVQGFLSFVLEQAIELTESKFGCLFNYHEERRELVLETWSKSVLLECKVADSPNCFKVEGAGLWAEALRRREALIINDLAGVHPSKKGFPVDHVALSKFMCVPVFRGEKIIAVVGLANKVADYDESDLLQVSLLIDAAWKVVERRQAQEEQDKLRDQLLQAQKMESVGRLAGGIAHDFNNMLTIIMGQTELILEETGLASPLYAKALEVQKAAERSADLTRQLLAFARKQKVEPRRLDLNATVEGMLKMLRRLIGEDIQLEWKPGANLWPVKIDPSQVDQVLANLCVNARDAIDGTGKIAIQTANTSFMRSYGAGKEAQLSGDYVSLQVVDNGCGMDEATQMQLFEPFFTTKEIGKGTGLGLSTVYGIASQNKGHIRVYSRVGAGSTFTIYLPRFNGKDASVPVAGQTLLESVSETILVVEDEPTILKIITSMLQRHGYQVLAASAPQEALHLAQNFRDPIHLLLTDVVMPGINGRDLADQLRLARPQLKALFMSGYTADILAGRGIGDGFHFIQKPFTKKALTDKVRRVLEEKCHVTPGGREVKPADPQDHDRRGAPV